MSRLRRRVAAGACTVLALGLAACSSEGPPGTSSAPVARYTTPLTGVCPDPVVVQTGWWPEVSMGFIFQLLGPHPTIDEDKNRVTGSLGATGVELEIRSGGPAVGFQPVSAVLAQDDTVLLGSVATDEAVQNSGSHPAVAVFAPYEKTPLAFLWGNPAWEFDSVADIGRAGVPVLGGESTFLDVFEREGLLGGSQVDTSYQGSPDRFVAADGDIAQEGFVTNEPYRLEHDVAAWGRPVEYLLLAEEYPVYQSALSVREDELAASRECLSMLVPLFQQAQADYLAEPGPTNQLLLDSVDTLGTGGYGLSPGLLAEGNAKQRDLGLVANGRDGVLGSFDTARVQQLIDRLAPVFEEDGSVLKAGLTPRDLVTNEFLDTSISLH